MRLHAITAAKTCPTIRPAELHPHVLRHTCAMSLLHAGIDTAVIALWLGHADIRSTGIYLHTDLTISSEHSEAMTPPSTKPGCYRPATNFSTSSKASDYADHNLDSPNAIASAANTFENTDRTGSA